MKQLYTNYSPKAVLMIIALCVSQFLVSCSTDDDSAGFASDGTRLIVDVLGVTDLQDISASKLKADAADMPAVKEGVIQPKEMRNFQAFDAQVSFAKDDLKKNTVSIGQGVSSNIGSGKLMAAAMEEGITYRLMVYTQDGTFVSSTQMTSGIPGEVYVRKGGTYNWYAVSYHNTDDIPEVDEVNPELNVPQNTDLLYASGTVTVGAEAPDDNVPLGIVFQHQYARIALELNTMGMFADMNSVGVTVTGATASTGTFGLIAGDMANISTEPVSIDFSDFVNVEPNYDDNKVAYFYTAVPEDMNFQVAINALDIELDDGTNRQFSDLAANPAVFDFTLESGNIQTGGSFSARINLIESPLSLGGVEWARQNLYYVGGHNPYRFHHTYAHTDARNTYFSFKGLVPGAYGIDSDPCLFVYPEGVWRQATESDYRNLTGVLGIGGETVNYGTVGDLGYFEYPNATGVAAPYPSNDLRFNMNGFGIQLGLVEGLITIDLGSTYGTRASYWTSTAGLDLLGLAGLGAWFYNGRRTGLGTNSDDLSATLLNVDLIGINVIETDFRNIRCVRN